VKECIVRYLKNILAISLLAVVPVTGAMAQTVESPWRVHVGAHVVDPTSGAGRLAGMKASVDSSTRPSISVEYMLTNAWSIEALAALPFKHEVSLAGQKAVSAKQLPPVLGVNYHFLAGSKVSPFLGVGVNYTHFYDAKGKGALDGAHVDLGDSWGVAWHGGVDIAIDSRWMVTADLRYIDIDTKAKVGGAKVGTAHVDPWVYGISIGYSF
jgi:outer membrane protein